ncbi:efflux transporter outer membrane subunit [Alcaligenaceae bacterium LF4-65]|uniref:Efflux transporter outer membrane subunit n=1 Tax=Zwartia hollandica TaxID=324606 RepID=A0A953T2K0_9BURK|nr:efflux transporter outer membrane subunit [Zwartia hollandica]MBZ1350465.1 efflux transporter outer membrane subunit [Zwartia hollandica]
MIRQQVSHPITVRSLCSSACLIAVLLLTACAPLPPASTRLIEKLPSEFATSSTFTAAVVQWPTMNWWNSYQDAQLDQLIEEGLRGSPNLAIAQARLNRAQAYTQVAGAPLQPQISATAAAGVQRLSYNYLTPDTTVLRGWNQVAQTTLSMNWEIDFWGKYRSALAAATSELQASEAEQAQAVLVLTTALTASYAELARLFAQQTTSQRAVEIRTQTSTLFKERFNHGLETLASVREADSKRAQAKTELLLIAEQIDLQRNRIAALLGAGPDRGRLISAPKAAPSMKSGLPENLTMDLLGRRPDIVAARLQTQAFSSRIDQRQADFYPNINLVAFIGVQSLGLDRLSQGGSQFGAAGPAISLPIFTGGRLQGELRAAQATYDESVAIYNRTLTAALQEVADAITSIKALTGQLEQAELGLVAAREAFTMIAGRYRGGLANYIEVLIAEDIMLTSLRSVTELRARRLLLDVLLIRALGGGYQQKSQPPIANK